MGSKKIRNVAREIHEKVINEAYGQIQPNVDKALRDFTLYGEGQVKIEKPKKKKKRSGPSTTQLSVAYMESRGWECHSAEQKFLIPGKFGKKPVMFKRDFCGALDYVCYNVLGVDIGLQVTDYTSMADHIDKVLNAPKMQRFHLQHNVEVHGWIKDKLEDGAYAFRRVVVERGRVVVDERKIFDYNKFAKQRAAERKLEKQKEQNEK